jgi:serine/threonine-protein kinase
MDRGLEAFQQAVRLDPDYAVAHAAIAEAYMLRVLHGTSNPDDARRAAREALDRALAIDPELPAAHVVAGNIRLLFDWDWAGAEAEFRKAIEAAPGSSLAHMEYAWCQWSAGRHDEALVHSQKALELDPLSRGPMHHVGFTYLGARRYPEAVAAFRRTLEVYPEWIWGWVKMGIAQAYDGKAKDALAAAEKAEALIQKGGETPCCGPGSASSTPGPGRWRRPGPPFSDSTR